MSSEYPAVDSFEEMRLHENLLRYVHSFGFERPSPFQQRVISPILDGKDVVGQAQSGSGKTAAFVVGVLQRIDVSIVHCQGLILLPTRESADQAFKMATAMGIGQRVQCGNACTGSVQGQQIVIGTPDCVFELVEQGKLQVKDVLICALDGVDEMFSLGLRDKVYNMCKKLPPDGQLCLSSASMTPEIRDDIGKLMRDVVTVLVKPPELTLEGVRQFHFAIEKEEWKLESLGDLFETLKITQAIIYCNSRDRVDSVSTELQKKGIESSRVLVSTDLRERGMVPLVINYDLPQNIEHYLNRVGRSASSAQNCVAINFMTNNDVRTLKDIERYYHIQIEEMPVDLEI